MTFFNLPTLPLQGEGRIAADFGGDPGWGTLTRPRHFRAALRAATPHPDPLPLQGRGGKSPASWQARRG